MRLELHKKCNFFANFIVISGSTPNEFSSISIDLITSFLNALYPVSYICHVHICYQITKRVKNLFATECQNKCILVYLFDPKNLEP